VSEAGPEAGAPAGHSRRFSRRGLLGAAVGGAGVVVAGGVGYGIAEASSDSGSKNSAAGAVAFYGEHQAGIATDAQDRLAFAAFDVTSTNVEDLKTMLGLWAAAASRMTAGLPVGIVEGQPQSPPVDTGEALGLAPAELTITVGFGPSLFDERFGLAKRRPAALTPLPSLPGDALDPTSSDGDICVQACSNDPVVAFHVIRNFARIGRGTAVMRWSQLGFGRTSSTSTGQATPRNLMGFKDGTNNIKSEDKSAFDRFVWVGDETDQEWMRGGSYLVSRRIRMQIESWDADYLADQENVIGRVKDTGAPLGEKNEFDTVNLAAKTKQGEPVIPPDAHIRLASPDSHGGEKILRRGYSFTDGNDPSTGQLEAGLFFICYQKDPRKQFVPIQTALGTHDSLNEYIKHVSSALFAVPPGVSAAGDWFGRSLFS
jgi:deferrochelatase/peroxidase EfeB